MIVPAFFIGLIFGVAAFVTLSRLFTWVDGPTFREEVAEALFWALYEDKGDAYVNPRDIENLDDVILDGSFDFYEAASRLERFLK